MKERRFPRLLCFYKTLNNQAQAIKHLYSLPPPPNRHYNTHNISKVRQIFWRAETFNNSFLSQINRKWNKLDIMSNKLLHVQLICKALLDFIGPTTNSAFGTNAVSGLKLLTCFVLVWTISKKINLNLIFRIHWTHFALVPFEQKTPIRF